LLNADFFLNQRGFAGGALAAGSYGYDRWGAYVGGANYTVSGSVLTLVSGAICQPVESPGLAGQQVTVSVESPTAALTVTLGTAAANASGTIAAGSGRKAVTLTVPAAVSGDLQVRLSGSNVSFSRPKLEVGAVATAWETPNRTSESVACQRYYQKSYLLATPPGSGGAGNYQGIIDYFAPAATTGQINVFVKLGVTMRGLPAVTLYDLAGAVGKVFRNGNGTPGSLFGMGDNSFNGVSPAGISAVEFAFHWTAEAELTCTN
jgi:hypothetical protein